MNIDKPFICDFYKKIILLFMFIFLISLTSCGFSLSEVNQEQETVAYMGKTDISFDDFESCDMEDEGSHYVIYRYENDKNVCYRFEVFDDNKNVVLSGSNEWKEPQIDEEDNIVSVMLSFGTLADVHRYYDTQNNILSDEYNNVFAQNGAMICYYDDESIVVTNAFEQDEFYTEIKRDFYDDMAIPVCDVYLGDDELIVSYYANPDGEKVTEIIYLTEQTEYSSIMADENIVNSEKSDMLTALAEKKILRAYDYLEKIKDIYQERIEEFEKAGCQYVSLDDAYKSLDDYCEYLENEYSANIAFFEDLATIKYTSGSYGSIFLAEKKYECAKSYADKLEDIYNDLIT